jgi:molybdenum cofactor cytidylyltransferase
LEFVNPHADAVIFFTIDQPFLTPDLIDTIINLSSKPCASIIATRVEKVITIPMLFRRDCFSRLEKLEGETGGKKLLNDPDLQKEFVDWDDERILVDIDSEADYETALRLESTGN